MGRTFSHIWKGFIPKIIALTFVAAVFGSHSVSAADKWRRESNPYYKAFSLKGTGMFTWGFEWGSTLSFYDRSSYIFMAEEGFAVEGNEFIDTPHMNAFALAFLGYYVSRDVVVSLNTGWQGIQNGRRIIPVTGRIAYTFAGLPKLPSKSDEQVTTSIPGLQHFVFFDTGLGISQAQLHGMTMLAKAGYGLRIPLGYGTGLDTMISFQSCYAHPEIYDNFADKKVLWSRVGKSDSVYLGVSLSMAVRF